MILPDEKIELIKEKAKEPEKKTSKGKRPLLWKGNIRYIFTRGVSKLEINSRYEHNITSIVKVARSLGTYEQL